VLNRETKIIGGANHYCAAGDLKGARIHSRSCGAFELAGMAWGTRTRSGSRAGVVGG
jgi:hypothetical protein